MKIYKAETLNAINQNKIAIFNAIKEQLRKVEGVVSKEALVEIRNNTVTPEGWHINLMRDNQYIVMEVYGTGVNFDDIPVAMIRNGIIFQFMETNTLWHHEYTDDEIQQIMDEWNEALKIPVFAKGADKERRDFAQFRSTPIYETYPVRE